MGVKGEKARQSCWCWTASGRQLEPVKPTRCHKMYEECSAFSKRLTTCESQIAALKKATDTLLATSEKVLTRQLPQVWENNEEGTEVFPVAGTGAPMTKPGQLQRSHSMELQSEVHQPLAAWQQEFQRMKVRLAEVDRQSLRLDAARRTHYKDVEKQIKDNVMKQDNTSARRRQEADSPELTAARTAFYKVEGEVHAELIQLEKSAREVQLYITKAMAFHGHTLTQAALTHAEPAGEAAPVGAAAEGGTGTTGKLHPGAATGAPTGAPTAAPASGGAVGQTHSVGATAVGAATA